MHVRKKMKTSTGSPFNSTSLLESPVVSVPSNGATNNLKMKVKRKKDSKAPKCLQIWSLIYLTPQRVKRSYVKFSCSRL